MVKLHRLVVVDDLNGTEERFLFVEGLEQDSKNWMAHVGALMHGHGWVGESDFELTRDTWARDVEHDGFSSILSDLENLVVDK